MAVAVILEFEGGTLDQYNQVVEKMGFEPGGSGAPGGLFHWATKTDNGFRVTDVWETRERFEQFAEEQIVPYSLEVGLPEPEISFHEVHNHLVAP
ncbi:MAG: hypothetical protein M3R23_00115 [Actinomycetota bacterium]|nr:hypothetical protein [Actinomycetota bacterium]